MNIPQHTSVLIVGGGPAGLTLANLLGAQGIATLLIERNPGCVAEPRAVALDGESMRTLQAAGLVDEVRKTIKEGFIADYVNARGTRLFATDLSARPYGFCLQNTFDQPTLEKQLLAGLERFDCVCVHHNVELIDFEQGESKVHATLRVSEEKTISVNARYLVGCDGGHSSVRQQLGIAMVGDRLPQKWLVIDTVDKHLVGEPECRFYCDPARPAMTLLRPAGERRWEWMLVGEETSEQMLDDKVINALLAEHTDPEQVNIYRKCVYGFSAVVAEKFSCGRVFLAGDAAHMTPPFAGQGLNAGIRDVSNLAWKLVGVVRDHLPEALLDTYDQERHDAARSMVGLAVSLGDQIQPTDTSVAAERDAFFAQLNTDPSAAEDFGKDVVAPLHDIRLENGWFAPHGAGGRMLPQPEVDTAEGQILLDDILGSGFCALVKGSTELPSQVTAHPLWCAITPTVIDLASTHTKQGSALDKLFHDSSHQLIVLRPDRFVLADINLDEEPERVLESLHSALTSVVT
jgi:3-(3-hydroxy-phenyl)propionate hydroxylase